MANSRHAFAALVMLLFAGGAQAWTCAPGYKDCDGNWLLNGCEVNTNTDDNNCGYCGYKCGSLCGANVVPACKSGKCEFSCKPPYLNCDSIWKNGCEVDGSSDVNNCGSCGNKCIAPAYATATCANSKCVYNCKPGWKNCDGNWANGCETDIGQDMYNCGACGNKCIAPANASAKCAGGKCEYTCKPGFFNCDGDWTNGCESSCASDVNNCGACGVKCAARPNAVTTCNGGKCVYTCKPGFFNCDGDWTNGCESSCASDVNNCGACGVKCVARPNAVTTCNGGKCVYACKPGFFNCDGDWTNGCESSCASDVNNCGACGVKCVARPNAVTTCNGGKCVYTCKPGFFNCDGDWTNGCESSCASDVNNCGACGVKCVARPNAVTTCNGGKCVYTCKPGFFNCDGDWTNGCESSCASDVNNCGACGVKCAARPNAVTTCSGGKCVYTCKPGFFNCDGDWTNGCESSCASDVNNCGACGVKCVARPNAVTTCNGGKCVYTCKPGFFNCDGDWTNGCESSCASDVNNCGACGVKCVARPNAVTTCNGGKCVYACKPGFSNCDGDWSNGCEAYCISDSNNCGACGVQCKTLPNVSSTCVFGKCVYACKPGFNNCDMNWMNGCESEPAIDVSNCGRCGNECRTPKYAGGEAKCTYGKCASQSCKSGWTWVASRSCCVDGGHGGRL